MVKELNVLKPTGSDLYPTPDERDLLGDLIGGWNDTVTSDGAVHGFMQRRALRAFRIGFHANAHDCQAAYERGYVAAEADILAKTT